MPEKAPPLRVLLVDNHEVVRSGVKALLQATEDVLVSAEAGSGREAIDEADRARPDVVVMDVRLGGRSWGHSACIREDRWPWRRGASRRENRCGTWNRRRCEMKFVVVYESMFGNTEAVAQAIAAGLREAGEVKLGTVDALSPEEVRDAALLVAGGPTHAHGMARRNAHEAIAGERSYRPYGAVQPGHESLRGWIERLTVAPAKAAVFDTRFNKPMLITGSAAKKIAARLERKGYSVIEARSFFVETTGGPLAEGESDRALEWGRELGARARSAIAA